MPCYVTDPLNPGEPIDDGFTSTLLALKAKAMSAINARCHRRIESQTNKIPFKFADGTTTLTKYLELDTWTPEQAACLVAGIKPETMACLPKIPNDIAYQEAKSLSCMSLRGMEAYDDETNLGISEEGMESFETRMRVLELWNSRENPPAKVTPSNFLKWCESKGISTAWLAEVDTHSAQNAPAELARHVVELARLLESKTPAPLQFKNGTRLTKYLKRGTWTPEQAAFLVCGIDADTVQNQFCGKQIKHGKLLTGERITEQSSTVFLHADEVLELWNRQANPPGKIAPVDFVEWCESKKIDATWLSEIKTAPVKQSDTPAPKVEAVPVPNPSGDTEEEQADSGVSPDETLAALFDPVTVEVLEKTFPAGGKWKSWAERANRNGLKDAAKVGRGLFNPYKAAVWFINQGVNDWNLARCNRALGNNLPARSSDLKCKLTGDID